MAPDIHQIKMVPQNMRKHRDIFKMLTVIVLLGIGIGVGIGIGFAASQLPTNDTGAGTITNHGQKEEGVDAGEGLFVTPPRTGEQRSGEGRWYDGDEEQQDGWSDEEVSGFVQREIDAENIRENLR